MEVCVTNFGGRLVSIMVPDKTGKMTDVVLGFDSIADYQHIPSDFGAAIGRYANRINKGKITLDGQEIQLPTNNFGHCLHGGPTGWQYQVYEANQTNDSTLVLTIKSPDGDNNFPGNVTAHVTYSLTADNAIDIQYDATTDKTTVINMTNHSYFNLSGDPSKPATDHVLYVASDSITPVDSTFMTTGEMMAVKDTPFDFNTPKTISPDVTDFTNEQVKFGNGFDHNWVLKTKGDINQLAAKLTCPTTGISLEVYTNEPGIQVYTGIPGRNSERKERHCLSATGFRLSGNTTLSRQPQQAPMAFCYSGSRTNLPEPLYFQIYSREITKAYKKPS